MSISADAGRPEITRGVKAMRVVILLSAIVLSACSTQHAADNAPAGTATGEFTVRCQGDWVDCYKQASSHCGNGGYREIGNQPAEPVARYSQLGITVPNDGWDISTGPADGMVTFRCN
jgi:hypothetical protein